MTLVQSFLQKETFLTALHEIICVILQPETKLYNKYGENTNWNSITFHADGGQH